MKKEAKILTGLSTLLVVGGALALYAYDASRGTSGAPPRTSAQEQVYGMDLREEFVRDDSPTLGPKDASVTLVEFLDPECESCRAFFPVIKRILADHGGQIRFVVRYMPFHTSSLMAIAATESAGLQGKYWEMQELLFQKADEWGHKPAPERSLFITYAGTLGLDVSKFTQNLADPKWEQKALRDMEDGKALGVNGTPTLFLNGERVKDLTYEDIKQGLTPYLGSQSGPVEASRN